MLDLVAAHAVEAGSTVPALLFAGTEFGLFFTIDGGTRWTQLTGGVPTVAFRDLEIQRREADLVAGTFGRGFYVLTHLLEAMPNDALVRDLAGLCRDVLWQCPNLDERGFAPIDKQAVLRRLHARGEQAALVDFQHIEFRLQHARDIGFDLVSGLFLRQWRMFLRECGVALIEGDFLGGWREC